MTLALNVVVVAGKPVAGLTADGLSVILDAIHSSAHRARIRARSYRFTRDRRRDRAEGGEGIR